MRHRQIQFAKYVHILRGTADMSGEFKRQLIDRPIKHGMTLFEGEIIPGVIEQCCACASVVVPVCCLASRGAVAYKSTTHATRHFRYLSLAPSMAGQSVNIAFMASLKGYLVLNTCT